MDELELLRLLVVKLSVRAMENPVAFSVIIVGSSIALALLCPCIGVETIEPKLVVEAVDVATQTIVSIDPSLSIDSAKLIQRGI